MRTRQRKERDDRDTRAVYKAIRSNPGLSGMKRIAEETGLTVSRVEKMIRLIQSGEPGLIRIEYGTVRRRGRGLVTGWYAMDRPAHLAVLDGADNHDGLSELGLRRRRLVRLAQAAGIVSAEEFVVSIEQRLGVQVELLTQTDLDAFEALLKDEAQAA